MPDNKQFSVLLQALKISLWLFQNFAFDKWRVSGSLLHTTAETFYLICVLCGSQVSNLIATNEVLLEQNAQFRSQAKVMTLSSTPAPTEQSLAPPVGAVSSYNHGIAQTHTTLSSAGLQPRPVTQQDLVAPTGAPAAPPTNAAPPTAPPPHLNPEITPLSAALAQTIAQGMAPPVSMAPVAVSVAPVAVSMTQPLPGITMSHATTPMVSYPIASQSMRITTLPHQLTKSQTVAPLQGFLT